MPGLEFAGSERVR